jgi:hypothetical protein
MKSGENKRRANSKKSPKPQGFRACPNTNRAKGRGETGGRTYSEIPCLKP